MKKKQKNKFLWLNYFRPNIFIDRIDLINIELLKRQGFKMILCDLDNTLVPHFTKLPTTEAINFVRNVQNQGMKLIIVSNNSYKRVSYFSEFLAPNDFIYNAKKPLIRKIKKMLEKYEMNIEDVLFIGDQFITDIFAANRLHCRSILTLPIVDSTSEKNGFILQFLNHFIYKRLEHQNMLSHFNENNVEEIYEFL